VNRFPANDLPATIVDTIDRTWTLLLDPSGAIAWTRGDLAIFATPDWDGARGVVVQFDVEPGAPASFVVPWSVPAMVIPMSTVEHYVAIVATVLARFVAPDVPEPFADRSTPTELNGRTITVFELIESLHDAARDHGMDAHVVVDDRGVARNGGILTGAYESTGVYTDETGAVRVVPIGAQVDYESTAVVLS
jgi:hypothetical protein